MALGGKSVALKRRLKIAELIRRNGEMRVDDLSAALGVSVVTIRSDLSYLEDQGLVFRSFGKAVTANRSALQPAASEVLTRAQTIPMLRVVRQLVEAGQPVLIGPGDLPLLVIPFLAETPDLTVILSTLDAVPVAQRFLDCSIHVLGGEIGSDGVSLEGSQLLESLHGRLIGTFVFQAKAITSDGELVLPKKPMEPLCHAACARAERSLALVSSPSLSLMAKASPIAIGDVDDLVFPAPPDVSCRKLLAASGFQPGPTEVGADMYYQRNKITQGGKDVQNSSDTSDRRRGNPGRQSNS